MMTSQTKALIKLWDWVLYIVVNFLSQVIFLFLLFQLHLHTLPYPKTKEKQKLPKVKN